MLCNNNIDKFIFICLQQRKRERERILRIFCNLYYNLHDLEKLIMHFCYVIKDILFHNYQFVSLLEN